MIPRVAERGHSFNGAAKYYLRDKKAKSNERVVWTHTVNLPTDEAQMGFVYMTHTAQHAEDLKREAGVSAVGRKSKAGVVYSFSLAWSPEQKPEADHMKTAALETLSLLGLSEHEAVLVAHNDTAHDHVHVIANLVNPHDGRVAVPSYDFLSLSTWAEQYEKDHGKIYCDQRVENNKRRKEEAAKGRELTLIKHREKELAKKELITKLYNESKSAEAFKLAIAEQGFELCRGDRRGFVLVDEQGKISSLSRQLKGQRAADIKDRLGDVVETLQDAQLISDRRKYFDRDHYETERQKSIVDAAIKEDSLKTEKPRGKQLDKSTTEIPNADENEEHKTEEAASEDYLKKLDALREKEHRQDRARWQLEEKQAEFYQRSETADRLAKIDKMLSSASRFMSSQRKAELEQLKENLKKNLENIEQRETEQKDALELKLTPAANDDAQHTDSTNESKRQALKQKWKNEANENTKDKDRDRGLEL